MEKIKKLYLRHLTDDGDDHDKQGCFLAWKDGILRYQKTADSIPERVTIIEANDILEKAGYEIGNINWHLLKNYDEEAQLIYQWTGKSKEELERILKLGLKMDIDPLQKLQNDLPVVIRFVYKEFDEPLCATPALCGKPYIAIYYIKPDSFKIKIEHYIIP